MKAYIPGLMCLLLAGCASEPPAKREAAAPEVKKEAPPPEVKPEVKKEAAASEAKKEAKKEEKQAVKKEAKKTPEAPPPADGVYRVKFETSKGPFILEVHRDWAPLGTARFLELVKSGYFNDAR